MMEERDIVRRFRLSNLYTCFDRRHQGRVDVPLLASIVFGVVRRRYSVDCVPPRRCASLSTEDHARCEESSGRLYLVALMVCLT